MTDLASLATRKYLTLKHLESAVDYAVLQPYLALGIVNPWQLLHHYYNKLTVLPTCFCGNALSWHADKRTYRSFCSKRCTGIGTVAKVKDTNLKKYGVETVSQLPEFADRIASTSLLKYGVAHYSQTPEWLQRSAETNRIKYGVERPAQSAVIREKIKKTNLERYGTIAPAQHPAILNKSKTTLLNKYGVDNYSKCHFSEEAKQFLSNDEQFSNECQQDSVFNLAQKYQISVGPIYSRIKELGITIPRFLNKFEQEVSEFIQAEYSGAVELNNSKIISPYHIDIYLPDINVGIECNGSYWHSENNGRGQFYHINKTQQCRAQGIRLIHIWEHNWTQKPEIIKSMLKSALNRLHRIPARKCCVEELHHTTAKQFLDSNHLQGSAAATVRLGLYHNGSLVAAMTFGKPRFSQKHQWELIRYANLLNATVVGGASKLFAYFVANYAPHSVISYCDLGVGTGNMYTQLGFAYSHSSKPNYFYTLDYRSFESRHKYQKHKLANLLEVFDPNISEWGNMKVNGWDRIWDCGNAVYIYNNT